MSSTNGSISCILNASAESGNAQNQRDELERIFAKAGADVPVIQVQEGDDIRELVSQVLKRKCDRLLAAGGDGTINAVASCLIGSETALGVLPLGTLNHFAKDMNIPLRMEDAVNVALTGRIALVDVGEVNGRVFLNNSSLGLYPGLVVQREALQRRGHGKWMAFSRALVHSVWRYSPLTVRLKRGDDPSVTVSTPFIFIGNNRYRTCVPYLGARPRLDEGKLWIYQAPHAGRMRFFILAVRALIGVGNAAELQEQNAQDFWVYTRARRLRVATDGEVATLATPLHYRVVQKGLAVAAPLTGRPA